MVRWDGFLVLDLALQVLDGISRLDVESDVLPGQSTYKNLHVLPAKEVEWKSGLCWKCCGPAFPGVIEVEVSFSAVCVL